MSTLAIISPSSCSVGLWPSDLSTVESSLAVTTPSLSLSKRVKASLNSLICSSVRLFAIFLSFARCEFGIISLVRIS